MAKKDLSQLDPGGTLKSAHDFHGRSFRFRDSISTIEDYYTHYRATYDGSGNPEQITYYRGVKPHRTDIDFIADVAGSLNNTYFFIYDPRTDNQYHVWYNVSGGGIDPAPIGSTGIEVQINTNDTADIVSKATQLYVKLGQSRFFDICDHGSHVTIRSLKTGETIDSADFNTGFTFTNDPGTQEVVGITDITYNGINPIWEGQELEGYQFNIFTGKFEKSPVIGVEVEVKDYIGHTPEQINGSVATAGTPVTLAAVSGKITSAEVYNPRKGPNANDKTDILLVSFDGTTYTSVPRGESVAMDTIYLDDFKVDSNNDAVNYEVILTHD